MCFTLSTTEVVLISLLMGHLCIPYYTTLTDSGWRRENGVLKVVWEVQANIDKAKACLKSLC